MAIKAETSPLIGQLNGLVLCFSYSNDSGKQDTVEIQLAMSQPSSYLLSFITLNHFLAEQASKINGKLMHELEDKSRIDMGRQARQPGSCKIVERSAGP